MKLISVNSRRGIINLFADFIVQKINKNISDKTIIQITDCVNFYVINGITTTDEIKDVMKIKDEFISKYGYLIPFDFSKVNLIDLIKYKVDISLPETFNITLYNSERPVYNDLILKNIIKNVESINVSENNRIVYEIPQNHTNTLSPEIFDFEIQNLSIQSEFPYGYSLSCGRGILYYFESIMYEIKAGLLCSYLSFKIDTKNPVTIDIATNSVFNKNEIISMIYDLFDFDFIRFNKRIADYNLCEDLINPLHKKMWLEHIINPKDKIIF